MEKSRCDVKKHNSEDHDVKSRSKSKREGISKSVIVVQSYDRLLLEIQTAHALESCVDKIPTNFRSKVYY